MIINRGAFCLWTPPEIFSFEKIAQRNVSGLRRILWMARDRWVEKLRCPNCRKAGIARLSATDEFSWEIQVDGVPEGFKVVGSESSSNFYCSSCDSPVEP